MFVYLQNACTGNEGSVHGQYIYFLENMEKYNNYFLIISIFKKMIYII